MTTHTDTTSPLSDPLPQPLASALTSAAFNMPYAGAYLTRRSDTITGDDLLEWTAKITDTFRELSAAADRLEKERDELRRQRDTVRAFFGIEGDR